MGKAGNGFASRILERNECIRAEIVVSLFLLERKRTVFVYRHSYFCGKIQVILQCDYIFSAVRITSLEALAVSPSISKMPLPMMCFKINNGPRKAMYVRRYRAMETVRPQICGQKKKRQKDARALSVKGKPVSRPENPW